MLKHFIAMRLQTLKPTHTWANLDEEGRGNKMSTIAQAAFEGVNSSSPKTKHSAF